MNDPTPLLVRRHLADDASAFTQLMRRYQDLVFRLCFRILGHHQDAEDATQETFTRVAAHLGNFNTERPIEPWLLAIAGNRCRSLLSRRRYMAPLVALPEPASDAAEQDRRADILDEEVRLALAGLRERHRRAFLMFHQRRMSYAEIAAELDCPTGSVKTWVHRARTELIRRLMEREVLAEQGHAM